MKLSKNPKPINGMEFDNDTANKYNFTCSSKNECKNIICYNTTTELPNQDGKKPFTTSLNK